MSSAATWDDGAVQPASTSKARGGTVLASLILVAAVANLNLSVANVALPSIGKAFNPSQTSLDLVAVGYSLGLAFCLLGFLTMLLLWKEQSAYWEVGLGYALVGIGVGFAGTPASHSLTGSVPVKRAGMASGTADLQRDLGGAIMQSVFGALLTVGYAAAVATARAGAPSADQQLIIASVAAQLQKSYAGATAIAQQYPAYAGAITSAAKTAFLAGDQWAYLAGILAILLGAALVYFRFPKQRDEKRLLVKYNATDAQ